MPGCCDARGCDAAFTPRFARRAARRYRRRGLTGAASRLVDLTVSQDVAGATVLEIGGGIGQVHLELLRRGASRATNLELSDSYEEDAAALAAEFGLSGRVQRRTVDVAASPHAVEPADVVVLHRVVCCYPDHERLLTAAADHARRVLVFSYPRPALPVRAVVAAHNAVQALMRREFRAYVHPPDSMRAAVTARGFDVVLAEPGRVWQIAVAARR